MGRRHPFLFWFGKIGSVLRVWGQRHPCLNKITRSTRGFLAMSVHVAGGARESKITAAIFAPCSALVRLSPIALQFDRVSFALSFFTFYLPT